MNKVSVCVLCYNQSDWIDSPLLSIVNQSSSNFGLEVLVCDGGSNDGSQEKIKEFA